MRQIFVTGGTGYMGRQLIPRLISDGFNVHALARQQSMTKIVAGAKVVPGNALDHRTYVAPQGSVFIHLVGTPHPSPAKAPQFREVDLPALRESVAAARQANVSHFIFVSVAHPAPVMKAYIEVRVECEALIAASGLNATILRPWYVVGPGHWWPLVLKPFYWIGATIPSTRESSARLGLVTLGQMVETLAWAASNPAVSVRILDVEAIRGSRLTSGASVAAHRPL